MKQNVSADGRLCERKTIWEYGKNLWKIWKRWWAGKKKKVILNGREERSRLHWTAQTKQLEEQGESAGMDACLAQYGYDFMKKRQI